jgi:cytochrome c-type biogenesis protein CcmH/NrfG
MILFISLSLLLFLLLVSVLWWQVRHEQSGQRYVVIVGLMSLAPITFAVYSMIGSPSHIGPQQVITPPMAAGVTAEDINNMVARLEQRLQGDTDDVDGLAMLARSYRVRGEFEKSIDTYQRLVTLQPENIEWLMSMVDIRIDTNKGSVDDDAVQWLQQAVAIQPTLPNVLWLLGLSQAQRGNNAQAEQYWLSLLPLLEGTEQQQELKLILDQLQAQG